MKYLIDTNVISESKKSYSNTRVRDWVASTQPATRYLSVMSYAEIQKGVELVRRRDAVQAGYLEQWVRQVVRDFDDRILPVTMEIAKVWAKLNAPNPLPRMDGFIAATAIVHGMTVVTRNTKDFERTGVRLVNPFA